MATWSLTTDHVGANAATAAIGLAATTAAADALGLHPLVGVGAGAVGALSSIVVDGMAPPERVAANLARWGAAGGWMTWALAADPWTALGIGSLATGSVLGASLGPWLRRRAKAPAGARTNSGGSMILGSVARENEEWRQRIVARGGHPFHGLVVEAVTRWENGSGLDVRVCLPTAGATVDQLRYLAPGLAADANLPHGCSIEVIEPEGEGQRIAIMRVPTRVLTHLDEGHPLWEEQRSILDGVPIGAHPNGDTAEGPMREESWLVVGKKGAGKTTLLWGITATVGMCRDALVWHIDLNGGGMTQPWVDVWLDGRVERCPVDWAAPSIEEAIRMTKAAVRIAKHRKIAYRKRKKQNNTNLLPVGPDLPEIVIILDEGAEAMAAAGKGQVTELAATLEEIQRIARNEAVNLVLSVLRGTGDLVPAAMSTQTGVGICMKVRQTKEIAAVFESAWELKLRPEHLTAKGGGWIGVDGALPTRYQGWNILPDDMEQMALRIARVRPDLDEASARVAGEDYATRYERMREMFVEDAEIVEDEPTPAAPTATSGTWTSNWDLFGSASPSPSPSPTPSRTALPAGDDGIPDAEIVEEPVDDILIGALRVMADLGVDRASRGQLAARLTGGDEELLRKRMADAGAGAPHSLRIDGEPARGWYRREVEAALSVTPA
ncbi:hypothetical protein [Marinactinospora rubrisoli]|uniref:FtsK domain-containing protein n=1 Tax=Marinactinospora rubrisoli TaxID=2715399 RepID=A0ABW2KNA1_9ACTN